VIELYQKVIAAAAGYMGPVAEQYIKRRCSVSCRLTDPAQLKAEHLEKLVESIGLTAEVYMSKAKAEQFQKEILALKNQ
jgi:hypothetical protein